MLKTPIIAGIRSDGKLQKLWGKLFTRGFNGLCRRELGYRVKEQNGLELVELSSDHGDKLLRLKYRRAKNRPKTRWHAIWSRDDNQAVKSFQSAQLQHFAALRRSTFDYF